MKVSDVDRVSTPLPAPEMPTAREWLRVVGAGIAIILICAVWTFWT